MSVESAGALESCTRVVLDLYAAIDAGRAREAIALFTRDAVFETSTQRSEGIDAVASFLGAREDDSGKRTLHVLANVRRDATAESAEVEGLLLVHRPGGDGAPAWVLAHAAAARHVLRRAGDRWLIAERVPA